MTQIQDLDFSIIKKNILEDPIKTTNNIYLSKFKEKIEFELPEAQISKNKDKIRYSFKIDNPKYIKLIELLNMLDEYAMIKTSENSNKWFNREINFEKLQSKYTPIYNLENENIFLEFNFKNNTKDDKLTEKIVISINGLEFYRNKFKYSVTINNIEIKKIDFNDIINFNVSDDANEINNDLINELADDFSNSVNTEITKKDLESIIEEKRSYTKRCFIEAESVSKAAENLRLKAIQSINELKNYEKTYEQYN